jgi:hypothetical protein
MRYVVCEMPRTTRRGGGSRTTQPVTPPPPSKPPSPLDTLIKKPPFRHLSSIVPPDLARQGWTARHIHMNGFWGGRGEARFQSLKQMFFTCWPTKFMAGSSPEYPYVYNHNWNPWMERLLRGFVNEEYAIRQGDRVVRVIGLTGCASASKSHVTSAYAVAWWMVEPDDSIAILTSTTKDMIRSRVWSVVRDYATSVVDAQTGESVEIGRLIDSQMKLISPSGSAKHSIAAYAVAHGETLKAIDNLKGLHAKRMLVVIDEANSTPEAIFNVLPNYQKGCKDLTIIIVGNPVSRLDAHGRALKPADGWPLASDEKVIEWRTEGVPEWELPPGLGMRFDGRDSPNVVLKRNKHPYLYLYEDWLKAEEIRTSTGGNLAYWSQSRGMWPSEGMSNVIFTEQLFIRCDAIGTHFTFESERETIAFLDVAFGGDGCILQFAEMGDVGGRKCLQLTDWVDVPIDPTVTQVDIDYQIARWVMQTCQTRDRRVKPECFGIDATGTGRGVAAIMAAEWSPKIHATQWGQGPTERPSAQNDGRPAKEVYATFVTELWFAVREILEAGQLRGFSRESISQLCARQYEMSGRKYKAETKDDMKLRLRYSPDHADAVVGVVEIARRLGLTIDGRITQNAQKEWNSNARAFDAVYGEPVTSTPSVSDAPGWAEQDVHGDVVVAGDGWD